MVQKEYHWYVAKEFRTKPLVISSLVSKVKKNPKYLQECIDKCDEKINSIQVIKDTVDDFNKLGKVITSSKEIQL